MYPLLLAASVSAAIYFAFKYLRQKRSIASLIGSIQGRAPILADPEALRGSSEEWRRLVDELNRLIGDVARLDRQSSGRLSQIEATLGSLQEGVLIIDRDNYVALVNPALAERFPELSAEVGARLEAGARSPDFLEFVRDAKKAPGPIRREIALTVRGQEAWFEISAARLAEAPEGSGPWFVFVLHDITKLKRLEAARRQFVANASHELKTPVSVIKGYAETLAADHATMDAAERGRFIETIRRHAERLALLINDLLSLSRLESDAPHYSWVEADLCEWLRETVEEYRLGRAESGRAFRIEFGAGERAPARYDPSKLRQVLDNLVDNAIKYSPAGGCIGFGAAVGPDSATFWVEDEGGGVPEAELKRIFERFYRVDKGRGRETGGTGLGLSIVKHIVEGHGGRVWAESAPTGGLRVCFALPLSGGRAPAPRARPEVSG